MPCGTLTEFVYTTFTQFIYIVLFHKSQPFQLPLVFFAGGDEVEPRGFQRAVPQHVRQLGYVPANVVKGPGEQVAQVVGEHFRGRHPSLAAQGFHLCPNLLAGEGLSVSGAKHRAGSGFFFFGVLQQLFPQLAGDEDGAYLSLEGNLRPAFPQGLHG